MIYLKMLINWLLGLFTPEAGPPPTKPRATEETEAGPSPTKPR